MSRFENLTDAEVRKKLEVDQVIWTLRKHVDFVGNVTYGKPLTAKIEGIYPYWIAAHFVDPEDGRTLVSSVGDPAISRYLGEIFFTELGAWQAYVSAVQHQIRTQLIARAKAIARAEELAEMAGVDLAADWSVPRVPKPSDLELAVLQPGEWVLRPEESEESTTFEESSVRGRLIQIIGDLAVRRDEIQSIRPTDHIYTAKHETLSVEGMLLAMEHGSQVGLYWTDDDRPLAPFEAGAIGTVWFHVTREARDRFREELKKAN